MMGFGVGMEWFGFFWMLLFWVGVIILAVWLIKLLFPVVKAPPNENRETPLSAQGILKTGYTQGELTTEQDQTRVRER